MRPRFTTTKTSSKMHFNTHLICKINVSLQNRNLNTNLVIPKRLVFLLSMLQSLGVISHFMLTRTLFKGHILEYTVYFKYYKGHPTFQRLKLVDKQVKIKKAFKSKKHQKMLEQGAVISTSSGSKLYRDLKPLESGRIFLIAY